MFYENDIVWICSDKGVLRVDKNKRSVIDSLEGSRINAFVKPSSGKTVWAASSGSTIIVYDKMSGKIIETLKDHKLEVLTLMACGDYVWSGGWDCKIRIWDAHNLKLVKVLEGHKQPLNTISVVPIVLPLNSTITLSGQQSSIDSVEQKGFSFWNPIGLGKKAPNQNPKTLKTKKNYSSSASKCCLYNIFSLVNILGRFNFDVDIVNNCIKKSYLRNGYLNHLWIDRNSVGK